MAASQRRLKAQGQLCLNSWFPISYSTTDCIELTSVDVSAKSVQIFTIINCYVLFCLLFKDCCVLLYLLFKVSGTNVISEAAVMVLLISSSVLSSALLVLFSVCQNLQRLVVSIANVGRQA